MDTKQYLSQIKRLDRQIQNKLSELYNLKMMASSISVSNEGERVQTSGNKDQLGAVVAKIVDMEKEVDKMVDLFVDTRSKIISQIDSMDDLDSYDILFMRYVAGKTFHEISEKTGWSIRKVFSLHGKALLEFEKKYGREYLENVQWFA